MSDRLKGIEERVKALGWEYEEYSYTGRPVDNFDIRSEWFSLLCDANEQGFAAAERLLACYEPGRVVEIAAECKGCDLHDIPSACEIGGGDCIIGCHRWKDPMARSDYKEPIPGPDCPGSGTYTLVRRGI